MTLKVTIKGPETPSEPQSSISIEMRRNLGGDYMIFDHTDIDIVVKPGSNTVLTLPKSEVESTDTVYDAQNRLFKFLVKKGVVDPTTVEGGDLYGTIEGSYYESEEKPNSTQVAIFTIGKFIEEERPFFMFRQAQEEIELERMADPDDEYSTELGEVPHAMQKGTIYANDFPSGANYRTYEEGVKKEDENLFKSLLEKKEKK